MIPFDDFAKVELKIAKILSAERISGSEKLLKLNVTLGDEERQIIAGIGRVYDPETLPGKEIVIVANLEPRMLMGHESQGMLIAADSETGPVLIATDREIPPGTKIK